MAERTYLEVVLRAEPHERGHLILAEAKADLSTHWGSKSDIYVRFRRTLYVAILCPRALRGKRTPSTRYFYTHAEAT